MIVEGSLGLRENFPSLNSLAINQIKAADYTLRVISQTPIVHQDTSLKAVAETDVYRLRRGLCLPSAAATCINLVLRKRVIGDNDGLLKVGDIYKVLLPFHNRKNLGSINGKIIDKPWWVVTKEGDMYHHTIVAFSEGLGIATKPLININSVQDLREFLLRGGTVALSLDNHFVLEQTLRNSPNLVKYDENNKPQILIEGPNGLEYRRFENGRHVVSIIAGQNPNEVIVADSFLLPQQDPGETVFSLPIETIDRYLRYTTGGSARGIAFARSDDLFNHLSQSLINSSVMESVPQEVVNTVKDEFGPLVKNVKIQ
jgi:hypothetical protein